MAKTLSQLRTFVRRAADIETDGNHITDAEVDAYINQSIQKMHSLLVDGTDGTLFAKNAGLLPQAGDNSFLLPSDFSQLVSVDIFIGHTYIRSQQADPQDYAQLATQTYNGTAYTRHLLRWNIEQNRGELFIFPSPQRANLAVQYIAEPPQLSLDGDTLNFPTFWYQWVVLDAAVTCNIKDETDPTPNQMEREKVEGRLRDHIRSMTPTRIKTIRKGNRVTDRFALPTINYASGS